MELLNFSDFEEKIYEHRLRNFYFAYKLVAIVLVIYILKFIYKYNYERFTLFFLASYFVIMISYPSIKKITQNLFLAIWSFYIALLVFVLILMILSGGIRAPGIIWLSFMPFLGANLTGRRGFFWGVIIVCIGLIFLIGLDSFSIQTSPLMSYESYEFEFRVNLIVFSLTTFYYTYSQTLFEADFYEKISYEKEKSENLLRILFHDLANPLQLVKVNSKRLFECSHDDKLRLLNQLNQSVDRMLELVDHVKKVKAIEDKKMVLDTKPHTIYECITRIEDLFQEKLEHKKLKLNIKNNVNDRTVIMVDQIYFTNQVLGNVISNAIKFSEKNGLIEISWKKLGTRVFIEIEDFGVGMSGEILEHLFNESCSSLSRQGTYGEIGTGYGMPLVKRFVEEFHGTIKVISKEKIPGVHNHGTKVTIELPVA